MESSRKSSVLSSPIGLLPLRWAGEKLAGLKLPPRPPCRWPRPGSGKSGWADLLGLTNIKMDLSSGTAFQRAVWEKAGEIPWGETRSYGWLAREIGRPGAARAAGGALHRNPLPLLIPCHRVIRGDGSPGGFGSGSEWKEFLLKAERIARIERGFAGFAVKTVSGKW